MSEHHSTESNVQSPGGSDRHRELFAQLVLQQTNLALMLLGKVAHPETGKSYKDVEGARLFIDQLEMLEAKTRGNVSKEESDLLKQSLMNLRLAFVDAVESEGRPQGTAQSAAASLQAATGSTGRPSEGSAPSSSEEEHRKKFSKKY
ncbi:MAG TPA: DUF1844 domain-containing protein [Verrucomicrobiae bacterium]|nr:DUF1844 domain-containing protein [Verrucomicrobiae bacterium]